MQESIARDLADRVQQAAQQFSAVVLTGARQTGKTTLVRNTFPSYHYVSLDLPSEAQSAELEPAAFLTRHPPPVIVDEVQYAPGLFRHVKAAIDSGGHARGAFVLIGSQKFGLMQAVSDSLAGRAAVLDLECLSAAELRSRPAFASILADPAAVVHRGFYPALWAQPELSSAEFFASYIATYLERDLRAVLDVGNLRQFERFLRLCAARSGHLLNKADLARDAGISPKTADAWLSTLEAGNQVVLVPPYLANLGKRLVKSPKLYLHDPGLAAYLLGLTPAVLRVSPLAGPLWETLVCAELRKELVKTPSARSLCFFRDSEGAEVDFVIEDGLALDMVECKWSELPNRRDARQMERLADAVAAQAEVRSMRVACPTQAPFPLGARAGAWNPLGG